MSDIALPAGGVPELPRARRLLGDERLAKLAGSGSARAFAALYERHHQALYRYCRSIVGNDPDAQDALQSAMMRAYAALGRQERDLAVKPWLFRIAHNEAVSILRRRRPELELSDGLEQRGGGLERTVELREELSTLLADLDTLPERQRAALVMRELSGLSIREIAQALSISAGAAKQTLFEARSSLHELSEGRAMQCEAVREAISARDGRVLRGRRIRAHLRACQDCSTFRTAIGARQAELRALVPPLPVAAAAAMLARVLAHGSGGHAGGAVTAGYGGVTATSAGTPAGGITAASSGTSLAGHAAASLIAKGLAGVAVVAAATVGTVHLTSGHHHRGRTAGTPPATAANLAPGASQAGGSSPPPATAGRAGSQASQAGSAGQAAVGGQPAAGVPAHALALGHVLQQSLGHGAYGLAVSGDRSQSGNRHARSGAGQGHQTAGRHAAGKQVTHHATPHHIPAHKRPHGQARRPGRGSAGSKTPAGQGATGGVNHVRPPHPTRSEPQPTTSTETRTTASRQAR